MTVQDVTPILNVSSIGDTFEWFERIGWRRGFSWNSGGMIGHGRAALAEDDHGPATFGSVCSDQAQIFLCCNGQGQRDLTPPRFPGDEQIGGVWMSWWMESPADVDELHARARQLGLQILLSPEDKPWGVREFQLRHPDGHIFRIGAGIDGEDDDLDEEPED